MESSSPISKPNLQGSEWFDAPGLVYFVQAGSDCESCKSIKMGITVRDGLLRRLRSIQSSNHTPIRLLGVIEFSTMRGAEAKECELHSRFAADARARKPSVGHEWFKATSQVMTAIKEEGVLPTRMINKPTGLDIVVRLFT